MQALRCFLALSLVLALGAQEAVVAKLAKRGNIRYGPSRSAAVAVTLPSGTDIQILGKVQIGEDTWYQIRFPAEGKAWMHDIVLKDLGNGTFEVTEDKARVRDDATKGANIVAELAKGDVVQDRGGRVGSWFAVYPANAVAYAHASIVDLPQQVQAAVEAGVVHDRGVNRLWTTVQTTYQQFVRTNDLQKALTLDWPGLSAQLADVAKNHSSQSVRLKAQQWKDGVDAVVREQQRMGAKPLSAVPQPPTEDTQVPAPQPPVQQPVQQPPVVVQQPVQPIDVQPQPPVQPEQPATAIDPVAAPTAEVTQLMGDQASKVTGNSGGFTAEGFLEQRGDVYVLFDNSSRVVAHLKPNGQVQLTDYFWREVGVKGQSQGTADAGGYQVPIILVDDVVLLQK
jgi:hypothetical protein